MFPEKKSGSLAAAENQFESHDYAQTRLHILLGHLSVLDFTSLEHEQLQLQLAMDWLMINKDT